MFYLTALLHVLEDGVLERVLRRHSVHHRQQRRTQEIILLWQVGRCDGSGVTGRV
jgi:hypothetical protein